MKQLFLLLITFLTIGHLSAQITIERADFSIQPDVPSVLWQVDTNNVAIPSDGAAQVWDYAGLVLNDAYNFTKNAGINPVFPEVNLTDTSVFPLLGLIPQTVVFLEVLNDEQYATLGRVDFGVATTLAPFTGNTNDSISTVTETQIYEEPSYFFQFPLNYEDTWETQLSISGDYEITIEGAGLDHVPGSSITYFDTDVSVSGYGTLILPNPDGEGEISLDVLMVKKATTLLDSFFLGGQPAPSNLLAGFGLVQGDLDNHVDYTFYAKDLPWSALLIETENGVVTDVIMSGAIKDLVSSSHSIKKDLIPIQAFPNPTSGDVQIAFEKADAQDWTLVVYNNIGQKVQQQILNGPAGITKVDLSIRNDMPGLYPFALLNDAGTIMANGQIALE